MTPEQIEKTVKHFGVEYQLIKTIQELAELQDELTRILLDPKHDKRGLIDESADVENMMPQLRHIFGISEQVDERKIMKVERLMKRIENQ